jgi:hypothetical protein
MHTAQASDNAPSSKHAVSPIGLGTDLGATAAVPATKLAGAAPARIMAIPPTDLLCPLRQLADGSRPLTPWGSRLAFARGDVAIPIRPIPGRPSLPPQSFTRSLIGSPCGSPTREGRLRAYHVASREPARVRPRLYAGGPSSAPDELGASGPGHVPFWSKPISTFGLFAITTLTAVHLGWPYHAPLVPNRRSAGSRDLGSRSGRYPKGYGYVVPRASHPPVARDARLGRGLLAEQQVLSPPLSKSNTVPATPSCRTVTVALRNRENPPFVSEVKERGRPPCISPP